MSTRLSAIGTGVRSVMLPMEGGYMLLPNAVVAEVIGYRQPAKSNKKEDWLMGSQAWRDVEVPLISFERLLGAKKGGLGHKARVVILYGLGDDRNRLPYYGVVVKDIPQMVRALPENIKAISAPRQTVVAANVELNGKRAWIPDVDALTSKIAAAITI